MSDQTAETIAIESIVAEWLASIHLSKPIRNIARDFSDGVLLAEIIAHFLPRYISLGNFGSVNSAALKRYNWETLNKVVLRHLNMNLSPKQMQQLSNAEPGVIESVLFELKNRIEEAISEARFRPSNRRSRSAASSRGGSSLCLNQLEDSSSQQSFKSSHKESISRRAGDQPGKQPLHSSANTEHYVPSRAPLVLDDFTKDQLIEKLYLRIRYLENSMNDKDERIDQLCRQNEKLMEIVQHRRREFDRKKSSCNSPSTPPFSHKGGNSTEFDVLNGLDYGNL